jgi:nucleoid-associated protein YgaU
MFGEVLAIEHPFDTMPSMELAMAGAGARRPGTVARLSGHDRGVFLRRRVLVAALLAVMVAPWVGPVRDAISSPSSSPMPVSRGTYLVRPGDTLWAIAERLAPGEDARPLVDAIVDANGLDGRSLEPGVTLVLPAR